MHAKPGIRLGVLGVRSSEYAFDETRSVVVSNMVRRVTFDTILVRRRVGFLLEALGIRARRGRPAARAVRDVELHRPAGTHPRRLTSLRLRGPVGPDPHQLSVIRARPPKTVTTEPQ